jgi:hypothetical protein
MIATDALYIALKSQREVLNDIHNPDCNLAIWTRQPNADIVQFLKQVERDEIHLCQTLSADKVSAYLRRNLRPFADETGKSAFIDDVSEVAIFFCAANECESLALSFRDHSHRPVPKVSPRFLSAPSALHLHRQRHGVFGERQCQS